MPIKPVEEVVSATLAADLNREDLRLLLKDKRVAVRVATAIRGFELGLVDSNEALSVITVSKAGTKAVVSRWTETRDPDLLELLLQLKDFSRALSKSLWSLQDIGHDEAVKILSSNDPACADAVCARCELDSDMLDLLLGIPSYTQSSFAWDPSVHARVGAHVSWNYMTGGNNVRFYPQEVVALHRKTRSATLDQLVKARSKYVRAALAARPHKPALPALARDRDVLVRSTVAALPQTPAPLIEKLLVDKDQTVRSIASVHPKASIEGKASASLLGVSSPAEARATAQELLRYQLGAPEAALKSSVVKRRRTATKVRAAKKVTVKKAAAKRVR